MKLVTKCSICTVTKPKKTLADNTGKCSPIVKMSEPERKLWSLNAKGRRNAEFVS